MDKDGKLTPGEGYVEMTLRVPHSFKARVKRVVAYDAIAGGSASMASWCRACLLGEVELQEQVYGINQDGGGSDGS